jgi:hypothetical protein
MRDTINEIAKATETARVLLEAGMDEARVLGAFFARVEALISGEKSPANGAGGL